MVVGWDRVILYKMDVVFEYVNWLLGIGYTPSPVVQPACTMTTQNSKIRLSSIAKIKPNYGIILDVV